jgi:hypothetical protein
MKDVEKYTETVKELLILRSCRIFTLRELHKAHTFSSRIIGNRVEGRKRNLQNSKQCFRTSSLKTLCLSNNISLEVNIVPSFLWVKNTSYYLNS